MQLCWLSFHCSGILSLIYVWCIILGMTCLSFLSLCALSGVMISAAGIASSAASSKSRLISVLNRLTRKHTVITLMMMKIFVPRFIVACGLPNEALLL